MCGLLVSARAVGAGAPWVGARVRWSTRDRWSSCWSARGLLASASYWPARTRVRRRGAGRRGDPRSAGPDRATTRVDATPLLLMFHGDPKGPSSKLLAAVREQGDDAVLRGDCRCARRVRRRRGGRVTGSPASWPGPSCVLRSPGRRPGPPRSFWPRSTARATCAPCRAIQRVAEARSTADEGWVATSLCGPDDRQATPMIIDV